MREDIMKRFKIGRHRLNDQLNTFADGMSFPQYINSIRMEVAYDLLTNHPEMTIADVAREVGFTAPNLREQFKRCYIEALYALSQRDISLAICDRYDKMVSTLSGLYRYKTGKAFMVVGRYHDTPTVIIDKG